MAEHNGSVGVVARAPEGVTGLRHRGACDASAGVALDDGHFLVASDEDDVLRVYRNDEEGFPLATYNLGKFLGGKEGREADIEGATRVGEVVYWITSHGRNRKGKKRPSRRRFFATRVVRGKKGFRVEPVGEPYRDLLKDLVKATVLQPFGLKEASKKPPKKAGGLNIEGLAATPDGQRLWVGFRNPVPEGKALLVPLENPAEVLEGKRARPGSPALLDLGGLGLREMEYVRSRGRYLLIAGPPGAGGPFRLYEWSGNPAEEPRCHEDVVFDGLNPEAVVVYGEGEHIQVLSDDGACKKKGVRCKDRKPRGRSFRSTWVTLQEGLGYGRGQR
jgi:hypothetical protein